MHADRCGVRQLPATSPVGPFQKSDGLLIWEKLAKLNWSADGLHTDSYAANPLHARAGHFKITLAAALVS